MKKNSYLMVCALMLCLAIPSIGQGATFTYVSGECTLTGTAFVGYGFKDSYQTFGPVSGTDVKGEAHALVRQEYYSGSAAAAIKASAYNRSTGGGEVGVQIGIEGAGDYGYMITQDEVFGPGPPFVVYASATVSTGAGIVYQVTPEDGEDWGDLGTVLLEDNFTFIGGPKRPEWGPIAPDTLNNSLGPVIVKVNGNTIYSRPADDYFAGISEIDEYFPIKIGDIVEITMSAEVAVFDTEGREISMEADGLVEMSLGGEFTPAPAPLPSSFVLLGFGLLMGLGGRLRHNFS